MVRFYVTAPYREKAKLQKTWKSQILLEKVILLWNDVRLSKYLQEGIGTEGTIIMKIAVTSDWTDTLSLADNLRYWSASYLCTDPPITNIQHFPSQCAHKSSARARLSDRWFQQSEAFIHQQSAGHVPFLKHHGLTSILIVAYDLNVQLLLTLIVPGK